MNVYRHQWSDEARAMYGYERETKKQTIDRLSRCTSDAGIKEYRRVSGGVGTSKGD